MENIPDRTQQVECFCGNKWIVEDREKYVYAAPVSKLTGADKLKVKQCPGCRKYYRVDFGKNTGKYFLCSCGQEVLIDKPIPFYVAMVKIKVVFTLLFGIFIFIVVPVWICTSLYSCASSSNQTEKTTISRNSKKISAWVFTQYLVEQRLKSPRTAKFPFGGAQNHVEETVSGIFIIRSYVDAQNAFGSDVRQRFFCKLQEKSDGSFDVLQLTFE